jgi:hypothetical protein
MDFYSLWGIIRRQGIQFWMNFFQELIEDGFHDGAYLDQEIPHFCFLRLVQVLLWNIENSNQLPQQLKHTRTKFYIYVIPEYRVPCLDIYKYPLPDTCTRWGVVSDACIPKYQSLHFSTLTTDYLLLYSIPLD